MTPQSEISNQPFWTSLPYPNRGGFQEVWYLKFNDPTQHKALWLRFTLLQSKNGFRKVAETWGIFFHKKSENEFFKTALKQTHHLDSFRALRVDTKNGVQIGECELWDFLTKGKMTSKGHELLWDFKMARAEEKTPSYGRFNLVPSVLQKCKIVKNTAWTVFEDLRFNGHCKLDGEIYEFKDAPGMQGHLAGPKNGHSWVWGHCNRFTDEAGNLTPFVFEGITGRASLLSTFPTPPLSSFYFYYLGKEYFLNTLWQAIRSRSKHTFSDWQFETESQDGLLFKGQIQADLRQFCGVTYEDTNGSFLYCSNSKLSDMTILVYRAGKLEARLQALGTAAFEIVSRDKNPYVPLLI